MSVVINTNVDSLKVQSILSNSTNKLSQAMERMSTGLKVNSSKDDAAGTVIAARMNVQMDGNKTAQKNVQNGSALLATAEGHLDVVQDNLSRIRDLTLQAKNGTYSAEEKQAMQDEVSQRIAEIDRVSDSSKYSSLQLFGAKKGQEADGLAKDGATFQVGANATTNDQIKASENLFQSVKFDDIVKDGTTVYNESADSTKFDIAKMSAGQLTNAVKALDKGIDNLTSRKSIIGSVQNRLESALDTLTTQYENLSSAKSIITDADIADEASKFTQYNILQQVSTSLLAQANQAPSIALSLI
jgi:flagellin